jgi:hypothetical protein
MKAVIKIDQRQLQLLDAGEAAIFDQASARKLPSRTAVEEQARFGEAMLRRIDHEHRLRGQSEEMAAVQRSRADRAEQQIDTAQKQIEALLQQNTILLQQNARLQAILAYEEEDEPDVAPNLATNGLPAVPGAQ